MPNTITIGFINEKGGVGKTTSTLNVGAGLALKGRKVLLIDMNPQGHLGLYAGITDPSRTITDVLFNGSISNDDIVTVKDNLHIIPATEELQKIQTSTKREISARRDKLLRRALQQTDTSYFDYILVDSPPEYGVFEMNVLYAVNNIFVPVELDEASIEGLIKLGTTIKIVQEDRDADYPRIAGIIRTRCKPNTRLHKAYSEALEKHYPKPLFETVVRDYIAYKMAQGTGQDIFSFGVNKEAIEDYAALCSEIEARKLI